MPAPTKTKRPRRRTDPRLAQLERGLRAPLSAEKRRKLLRRIRAGDKALAEVAAKHPVPDQIAPDFAFRPVVLDARPQSDRDG
jgi:hypothetical protein